MSKLSLFLITRHYPLGRGESFLETELEMLAKRFDVTVISLDGKASQTRELPPMVSLVRYVKPPLFLLFFKALTGIFSPVYKEEKKKSKKKWKTLWALAKAEAFKSFFEKELELPYGGFLAYTYWLCYETMGLCFLKEKLPNMKLITRMHRGDFYESKENPYQPFKAVTAAHVDQAFVVSEEGKRYFTGHYEYMASNVQVSRLGVVRQTKKEPILDNSVYVVSCSNLIAVKQVHLIIDALAGLRINVNWCHFGDGSLRPELEKYAGIKLRHLPNISYEFKGAVSHAELMKYYKNNRVDLLLNASLIEGVPVSVMEAFSFGIPVVAPDVGGMREIVDETCGFLLPSKSRPKLIANAILEVFKGDRVALSQGAYAKWEADFNAETNYGRFMEDIQNM